MPLQIGARDVAFPRLNAFSLWTFVAGAIILNIGWFIQDRITALGRRLVRLRPLTSKTYIPTTRSTSG
jgi:cytochrome c oxidase subunit 1